ncbi:MAG: hypothetical protein KIT22_00745 [Verrucomicrobiae bacterium]|nr:hypothetical protein [Verrucomicrobiae bacterium]
MKEIPQLMKLLLLCACVAVSARLAAAEVAADTVATETGARIEQARAVFENLALAEVPAQAAQYVVGTETKGRPFMVRAVVESALGKHPTAAYSMAKAILKVAPDQAESLVSAVLSSAPKQLNAVLQALLENDRVSLDSVLQVVAVQAPDRLAAVQALLEKARPGSTSSVGLSGGKYGDKQPPLFSGTPVTVQQTTVSVTPPPKRGSNDYPLGP